MKTFFIVVAAIVFVLVVAGYLRRERVENRIEEATDRIEDRIEARQNAREN